MTFKEVMKYAIGGIAIAMIFIATLFGAIYQQSLREAPLTESELMNQ